MRFIKSVTRTAIYGGLALLGLTGLVLLLTELLLQPPPGNLVALSLFLLLSGGLTLLFGLGVANVWWPRIAPSLRARILLASVLTAILALANVGFTASLMFLSTHDLALLSGLLGFSLGVAVLAAFSFSDSAARSFREVAEAARSINAGNLEVRVPMRSRDEAGELAAAFNAMIARLETSFDREKELEEARKELIASVSHDLRTPLASIQAMVEAINDGVVTDSETVKRYLRTIEAEVEVLSQLIDDLFQLSRIDAGVLELHLAASSIPDLISDTLGSMSPQATAKGLRLMGSVDEEVPPVVMDERMVQRVLYNLVHNAIRHTPEDGTIHIRAQDDGTEVRIEVTDTSEGIPKKDLPRLFERFYRSERSRSRNFGGAGLGLSIAKGIVEAHGGRLWVESSVGEGSTFGFALPKTPGLGRPKTEALS